MSGSWSTAVDDYFLNHSDFLAKLEDLTALPAGPTGLPPWPDFLVPSLGRPAAQDAIKALMARGFHKPGDVETRLGYYVGQIVR